MKNLPSLLLILITSLSCNNPNNQDGITISGKIISPKSDMVYLNEVNHFDNLNEHYTIDSKDENLNPQTYLNLALKVDKLARSLITSLLKQAVSSNKLSAEREDLIRNSIEALDYPESRIIRITSDYGKNLEIQKEEADEIQNHVAEIKSKIDKLEELKSLVKSLVSRYKKELLKIEK